MCDQEYFQIAPFRCEQCSKIQNNKFKLALKIIFSLIFILISLYINYNGLVQSIQLQYLKRMNMLILGLSGMVYLIGSYVKIAVVHFQFLQIVNKFYVSQFIQKMITYTQFIGVGVGLFTYSFECFISDRNQLPASAQQFILQLFIPNILVLLFAALCYLLFYIKKISKDNYILVFIAVSVYFLFVISIQEQTILFASCRKISDFFVVKGDLTQNCLGLSHKKMLFEIVFPAFFYYFAFLPLLVILLLVKRRNSLQKINNIISFGIFFIEYKSQAYLFEFAKFAHKFLFSLIENIFDFTHTIMAQMIIILQLFNFWLTNRIKPFEFSKLDKLQNLENVILIISISSSLIGENIEVATIQLILFLLIVLINIYFFIIFVIDIFRVVYIQFEDLLFPYLQRITRFKFFRKKLSQKDHSRSYCLRKNFKFLRKSVKKIKDLPKQKQEKDQQETIKKEELSKGLAQHQWPDKQLIEYYCY